MSHHSADSYVRRIREWMREPGPQTFVDLPISDEPLLEVVTFGHGKDTDIMIELHDGRRYVFGLGDGLRLRGCSGLTVEFTRWDDRSVITRYYGEGIVVASARIGTSTRYPDHHDLFLEMVAEWLTAGAEYDLPWGVSLDIELGRSLPG